jgi:hypothetical protein
VRLRPGLAHRYRDEAAERGVGAVGVKVFKTTPDARREAELLVPFHRDDLHRLPGLPSGHVQRSVTAGVWRGQAFVIQEWVAGDSLEDLIRRRWPTEPLAGARARSLVSQLLGRIVVPLWSAGTVWWDVRDANYCYDEPRDHLTLIDVDSLAAYADEILRNPGVWQRRDKGRETALARLRQMTLRLLLAQGLRPRRRVEAGLSEALANELTPTLARLGHQLEASSQAESALERFLDRLGQAELLRG